MVKVKGFIFTDEDVKEWIDSWLRSILASRFSTSRKAVYIKKCLGVNMDETELVGKAQTIIERVYLRLIMQCPLCGGKNEKCKLCEGVGGVDSVRIENILLNKCPHCLFCVDSESNCYKSEMSECVAQPANESESVLYFNFLSILRENKQIDLEDKSLSFCLSLYRRSSGNDGAINFIKEVAENAYKTENGANNKRMKHKAKKARRFDQLIALHT